jgi:hypothetical protein
MYLIMSQAYDCQLQHRRCKIYSATISMARFRVNIIYSDIRSSLQQRWRSRVTTQRCENLQRHELPIAFWKENYFLILWKTL